MKVGKIPETVLKRSVLKLIRHRRKEVISRPGVGLDCAQIEIADDEILVMSSDPITGTANDIGTLGVNITANDIAASGAEPVGIMLTVLLPVKVSENDIKKVMKEVEENCEKLNMEVIGGHTEVTPVVNQIVLTVTGIGKMKKCDAKRAEAIEPGCEIVMTKYAGLEGTSIIAREKSDELTTRYSEEFIDNAKNMMENISVVNDARVAHKNGALLMHDITEGGVYGALWEIACAGKCGIETDIMKIPIKQETVEICEFYNINPYKLISSGSLLIVAKNGNIMVDELKKNGIDAAVIGKIVEGNNKTVSKEDEIRFLAPPEVDELYKVINTRNFKLGS